MTTESITEEPMTSPFDPTIAFPVSRAQAYPHTWPIDPSREDAPIVDLDVDRLVVEVSASEVGMVTVAASTPNGHLDAYGQEYDLTPSDARALGHHLIAAAAECERAD
jgi:hypothetical protein